MLSTGLSPRPAVPGVRRPVLWTVVRAIAPPFSIGPTGQVQWLLLQRGPAAVREIPHRGGTRPAPATKAAERRDWGEGGAGGARDGPRFHRTFEAS